MKNLFMVFLLASFSVNAGERNAIDYCHFYGAAIRAEDNFFERLIILQMWKNGFDLRDSKCSSAVIKASEIMDSYDPSNFEDPKYKFYYDYIAYKTEVVRKIALSSGLLE